MGWRVGRGAQRPVDNPTVVEGDEDNIGRARLGARNSAGLDRQDTPVAIDATDIAERERYEAGTVDRDVGGGHSSPKLSEIHVRPIAPRQTWSRVVGIQTRIASTVRFAHAK